MNSPTESELTPFRICCIAVLGTLIINTLILGGFAWRVFYATLAAGAVTSCEIAKALGEK